MADTSTAPPRRTRLVRSRRDRVLRGVAGGLGARTGVDPVLLRIAFVVLTLAGGAGILLYAVALAVSDEPAADEDPPARPLDLQQAAAVGLMGLGVLLMLRSLGLWFGDALVWPAVLAGIASAVIWTRGGDAPDVRRATEDPLGLTGSRASTAGRIAVGATLVAASGLVLLTSTTDPLGVLAPFAGVMIGMVLLFVPWLLRLWEQLARERDERAREQARDEVAAHLHDSVLQTLALIQRSSDQPRRMVTLAREQERELRAWLYGDRAAPGAPRSLATAVDDVVAEVERTFELDVDAVVVGDLALDDVVTGLLAATREALVNVGKHAHTPAASCYVEVGEEIVEAYVRDRGRGFDPTTVDPDRQGLARSVHARLDRLGGGARVTSTPDVGTEVELWVPRPRRTGTTSASVHEQSDPRPTERPPDHRGAP